MITGIEQVHPDRAGLAKLREAADQVVGSVFYGTLLRTMRSSQLKGPYGHGGRGEEIFGAQLDQVLAERAGQAQGYGLTDAVVRQLAEQQVRIDRAAGKTAPESVRAAQPKTETGRIPA